MKFKRSLPVLGLLAVLFLVHFFSRSNLSTTYDEPAHLLYGLRVIWGNSDRFDDSKMPVSAINALPLRLAGLDEKTFPETPNPDIPAQTARGMTVWCGLLLGLIVFCWAAELYGYAAGVFALGIYAFEPNLIAHSQLITTDLYAALFTTLALYTYWRFLAKGGIARLTVSALTLGLAQIAKYSAAYLYPVFIFISLVWLWRQPNRRALWRSYTGAVLVYAAASVLVINAGFLFNRTLLPWGSYHFKSQLFQGLQQHTPALAKAPVPLPFPYLQGLDLVKYGDEQGPGHSFGKIYLLGETRDHGGFYDYYLIAFLFKTPLGLQLILLWALAHYWLKWRRHHFARNELFLAAPLVFFAVYFSFFFNAQIGIRYFLVVYPLLIIFAGSLLQDWPQVSPRARIFCGALAAWVVVSTLSYSGHYLSYFNELVGQRKNSYKILADSNLDWGQNTNYLLEYVKSHPGTVYNPPTPRTGHIIVDVNEVAGIIPRKERSWLHAFEPTDHLVYSYLIFDITASDLAKLSPQR